MSTCRNCERSKSNAKQYEFYYGCTPFASYRRISLETANVLDPGRIHNCIEGGKKNWICDDCILCKRLRSLWLALVLGIMLCAASITFYQYSATILSVIRELNSVSLSLGTIVVWVAFLSLVALRYWFLTCLGEVFKEKDEIGAALAFEAETRHRSGDSEMPKADAANERLIAGDSGMEIDLEPASDITFWTAGHV